MKHLIIAVIAVLVVSASVWAHEMYLYCAVGGCDIDHTSHFHSEDSFFMNEPQEGFYPPELDPPENPWILGEIISSPPGPILTYSPTPEDCTITLPPDARLESRITKLEAELRRVAALVYMSKGYFDGWHWVYGECGGNWAIPQSEIDQCLANVTIEEEKE